MAISNRGLKIRDFESDRSAVGRLRRKKRPKSAFYVVVCFFGSVFWFFGFSFFGFLVFRLTTKNFFPNVFGGEGNFFPIFFGRGNRNSDLYIRIL